MSFDGKYTPLQLNALAGLSGGTDGVAKGFKYNSAAKSYQGEWSGTAYTAGSLVSTTVLKDLTTAIRAAYTANLHTTNVTLFENLLSIGSGVCPALGNSKPSTFVGTYAGNGSWTSGNQIGAGYPPKNYPAATFAKNSPLHYLTDAWFDPASIWTTPAEQYNSDAKSYSFFSDGFIGCLAKQAYNEMWLYSTHNNQLLFANAFGRFYSYKESKNALIASYVNSKTFNSGLYSGLNDMTTSNISGVSVAFKVFGEDLIASGRAINLAKIDKFGLPSALLMNIKKNNAITDALKMALTVYVGLDSFDVEEILSGVTEATNEQETKIYEALKLISGNDLEPILYCLNCKTTTITTLADLLDLTKLLPNSYKTLTLPKYNIDRTISTSGKIYDFIYANGGSNSRIDNWGDEYLEGILPDTLVITCGAFAMTMQQIKFIKNMDIQKFAQVVTNLELTNKDLNLVDTTTGTPVDIAMIDEAKSKIALGSGNDGTFRMCDFYGSASGFPYVDNYFPTIQKLLLQIATTRLKNAYTALAAGVTQQKIDEANAAILEIATKNKEAVAQLNYLWNAVGTQLMIEQRAIPLAINDPSGVPLAATDSDAESFVKQIETYSQDGGEGQSAIVLERLSDITSVAGQSILASTREARNATRVGLAGGELQNSVDNYIDTCAASATAKVVNGAIVSVTVTNGGQGYTAGNPPTIMVYPVTVEQQAVLTPVISGIFGEITEIKVESGGKGYTTNGVNIAVIEISAPPQCQAANPPPQTYADTPYSQLIDPELVTSTSASPGVQEAIDLVTKCNCDCWNE